MHTVPKKYKSVLLYYSFFVIPGAIPYLYRSYDMLHRKGFEKYFYRFFNLFKILYYRLNVCN